MLGVLYLPSRSSVLFRNFLIGAEAVLNVSLPSSGLTGGRSFGPVFLLLSWDVVLGLVILKLISALLCREALDRLPPFEGENLE